MSLKRRGSTVVRVTGQYASGDVPPSAAPPPRQAPGPTRQQQFAQQPPPQQQQQAYQQAYQAPAPQQYQPPAPQQQGQPRAAVPPRRRIGAAAPPQQQPAFQQQPLGGGRLQQFAAAVAPGVLQQQLAAEEAPPTSVQRGQGADASDFVLPRSLLVDKEVITRTSGNRLGYISQLYVDPVSLSVASCYLRKSATSLGSTSSARTDGEQAAHVMLASLRQISDVVLVHDDNALMDPPADDSVGYCRLVGAQVVTQAGLELGRVRDFLFDPDSGAISTIKYDALGIPLLPQALFSCYSISWEEVVALGPTKLIVRTGTEARALKENDGIVDAGASALADLILGPSEDRQQGGEATAAGALAAGGAGSGMSAEEDFRWRSSPAYRAWYEEFGQTYEQWYGRRPAPPLTGAAAPPQQRQQRQAPPAPPRALPPPQSTPFAQAVQQQAPQQRAGPTFQQQLFQQQRQAVPAGGASGWGGQPPSSRPQQQQQFGSPPQQQQYGQPQQQQFLQSPPPQQQQQQQARQPPPPPQQFRQPPPQQQQQQPLPPQNGIPIIDRTPPPPYRRRDADGNYGPPPSRQPAPAAARQQAQPQPRQPRAPQAQRAAVVEPDAVIPGGLPPPSGSSGGATQVAEYRQL